MVVKVGARANAHEIPTGLAVTRLGREDPPPTMTGMVIGRHGPRVPAQEKVQELLRSKTKSIASFSRKISMRKLANICDVFLPKSSELS